MSELHQSVLKYIMDYDPAGEEVVKGIFYKKVSTYQNLLRHGTSREDLFQSFYAEKILKKKKQIIKTFSQDPIGIISYLKRMIENYLIDLSEKKELQTSALTEVSISAKQKKEFDSLQYIEALEITEKIQQYLSQEELKVLCHIVFKDRQDRNYCLEKFSQNAIYKKVERLKKGKLTEFIENYGFSYEGFELFLKEFLMSEICKKICL